MFKTSGNLGKPSLTAQNARFFTPKPSIPEPATPHAPSSVEPVTTVKGIATEKPAAKASSSDEKESSIGNRLIVGPDVKLKGAEINDCDTLIVEGRVEATLDSRIIRVAEPGSFNGTVGVDTAEIHGCFEGELTVRGQLFIHSTGHVHGKIRYGKISIEEGGQISGDIQATTANAASAPSVAIPKPSFSTA